MRLSLLRQRIAKRLSISSSSNSNASSSSSSNAHSSQTLNRLRDAPVFPPAYEDVPVFANAAPADQIPFLPYEIITEILYWAVIPAFDEYRQQDSVVHVQTLRSLAAVSTGFLSVVRRICRESSEIPVDHRVVPCSDSHYWSVCTFETAAAWMPVSVMAGIFKLNIFDKEKKFGKTVARVQGFQPNLTALIFLIWNRQAMERMPGVPRHSIYLPYPIPFARHNHHRSINKFDIVLKALANCRHLKFSYVRLSVPALHCNARRLLEAIKTIAPTRYLEVNMQILGWGGGEEHPSIPGFSAKLPLEILQAGLTRGASRVDIYNFRLDDRPAAERTKEMGCSGSLVNFIRARPIPDGAVTTNGGGVFSQLVIGGTLDFVLGVATSSEGKGKLGKGYLKVHSTNKVVVSPFMYSLTAVRDGQLEWMGDGEKFAANHFLELALQDGENVGTAQRRHIEEEWKATDQELEPSIPLPSPQPT